MPVHNDNDSQKKGVVIRPNRERVNRKRLQTAPIITMLKQPVPVVALCALATSLRASLRSLCQKLMPLYTILPCLQKLPPQDYPS